jgi:hypothetical protein
MLTASRDVEAVDELESQRERRDEDKGNCRGRSDNVAPQAHPSSRGLRFLNPADVG